MPSAVSQALIVGDTHIGDDGGLCPPEGLRRDSGAAVPQNSMQRYSWPGNVRELRNVLERAIVVSEGPVLEARHLGLNLQEGSASGATPEHPASLEEIERQPGTRIICLGDVIGYGADPLAVTMVVMQRCKWTILGNHDAAVAGRMLLGGYVVGATAPPLLGLLRDTTGSYVLGFAGLIVFVLMAIPIVFGLGRRARG